MSTLSRVKGQTNYKLLTLISTLKQKISFISTVKMRISLQVIYFFITLGLGSPSPDPDTINYIFNCVGSNCNMVNGYPGTDVGGVTHPKGSNETEIYFRGISATKKGTRGVPCSGGFDHLPLAKFQMTPVLNNLFMHNIFE